MSVDRGLMANDRYCLVGIGVMLVGVGYWAGWRIFLPKVFGYELVPRKETLVDGTVVTLVRVLRSPRTSKIQHISSVGHSILAGKFSEFVE